MRTGQRKWTCRNCGRCNETVLAAGATMTCEYCTGVSGAGSESPSKRPVDDDIRKRGVVARLRERYGEAREFVLSEPPLDAQAHGHLDWILGKQSSPEHGGAALGCELSELVVLWLQDLARDLDRQDFLPGAPGSDGSAGSTAGVRLAAAEGLRTATREFAEEFLCPPVPVPEP
jgi:hypothetical protein